MEQKQIRQEDEEETSLTQTLLVFPSSCLQMRPLPCSSPLFSLSLSLLVHSLKDDNERRRTGPNFAPPTKLFSKNRGRMVVVVVMGGPPRSSRSCLINQLHSTRKPTRPGYHESSAEEDINDFAVDLTRVAIQRRTKRGASPPLLSSSQTRLH